MDYGKFEIDFITRTEEILKKFSNQTEYEVTFFINCMIGLLIFPKEKHYNKISEATPMEEKYSKLCKIIYPKMEKASLQFIVRRIRNSLSHSNFEVIPDEKNQISKIIFMDDNIKKNDPIRFEFEVDNLRKFVKLFLVELKEAMKK